MTFSSIFLATFTTFLVLLIIIVNPFIKKVTNSYFFWLPYSLLTSCLVLTFRFVPDVQSLVGAFKEGFMPGDGILLSKVFLLDFCPFTTLIISLMPIFDYKRKVCPIVAPFALFGGLVTILFEISIDSNAALTYEYLFKGVEPNRAYFLIHFINAITGILVLINVKKITWWTFLYCNLFAVCYYLYIFIIIKSFNGLITDHVSGLLPSDWLSGGEYEKIGKILHLDYPWCMIVGLLAAYLFISSLIFLPKILQLSKFWRR